MAKEVLQQFYSRNGAWVEVPPLAYAPGAIGPTGPSGSAGADGATGATGPSGVAGATGATGPTGPTGVSVDAGNIAATGSDGYVYIDSTDVLDPTVADTMFIKIPGDTATGEILLPDQTVTGPTAPAVVAARGYVDQVTTVSNLDPDPVLNAPVRDELMWYVWEDIP